MCSDFLIIANTCQSGSIPDLDLRGLQAIEKPAHARFMDIQITTLIFMFAPRAVNEGGHTWDRISHPEPVYNHLIQSGTHWKVSTNGGTPSIIHFNQFLNGLYAFSIRNHSYLDIFGCPNIQDLSKNPPLPSCPMRQVTVAAPRLSSGWWHRRFLHVLSRVNPVKKKVIVTLQSRIQLAVLQDAKISSTKYSWIH